jgi:hypothetical protein
VSLARLHWGGGTPTLLPAPTMRDLARAIFDVVPLAEGAEFSVEIDPNEIDAARLDALAEAGMNRASIGVQDFDARIQAAIGRDQSYEVTRDAVEAMRARGIASLNADILYGLPHQTRCGSAIRCRSSVAVARPGGALRLRACAVDGAAPAVDPVGRAADARGAAGAFRYGAPALPVGRLRRDRHRPFRPARATGWRWRRAKGGCGATSRAIPTTSRRCWWGWGPRRSRASRRAMRR